MNAAAKTLSEGNLFRGDFSFSSTNSRQLLSICLWALVICSALAVIYVKNLERQYVYKLGQVTQLNSQLDIEQSQLLLESSMWAAPDRVRALARRNLNMTISKTKAIIMIPTIKR